MNAKITEINLRHRYSTTDAASSDPRPNSANNLPSQRPEFIRLPRAGSRCPWTSLSRASLNTLVLGADAPVKSVVLRQRGANRGVRLIVLASLLEHLNSLTEGTGGVGDLSEHPFLPGMSLSD